MIKFINLLLTSILTLIALYVLSAVFYLYCIAMGLVDANNMDMFSNSIRAILSIITNN